MAGAAKDDAKSGAQDAKQEAQRGAQEAKHMAKDTAEAAKARAGELGDKARAEAEGLSDKARDMATEQADHAKRVAADKVAEQADTIRERGRDYGEDSYQAYAADYLATNLSNAADVLRERDMGDLMDDVSAFARRNPALFMGGAALLGFGLARLMKASSSGSAPRGGRSDYVQPYDDGRFDPPQSGIRNTPHGAKTQRPAQPTGGFPQ
jgi:F0F1-type ATP synthase membrane subunit b/b'